MKSLANFVNENINNYDIDKIIDKIKITLDKYQSTEEYDEKGQFDLHFKNSKDPVGIYTYKNELFVLTGDGFDKEIEKFDANTIVEIYKQVCKKK